MNRPFLPLRALIVAALMMACLSGASFARDAAFIRSDAPVSAGANAVKASPKEIKPIDFGVVEVGGEKTVRSTAMVNDSSEPITIRSIEMIEANNGLHRLTQGCAIGKELAPGAACSVALQWEPKAAGEVSTDLVINHSGKIGFTVIAVRGEAKGPVLASTIAPSNVEVKTEKKLAEHPDALPPPAQKVEKKEAEKIAPVSTASRKSGPISDRNKSARYRGERTGGLNLIGTVGDRAIFMLPEGGTCVVSTGGVVEMKDGPVKLVSVNAYSADIMIGGKRNTLLLKAAPPLVTKAAERARHGDAVPRKNHSKSGSRKK